MRFVLMARLGAGVSAAALISLLIGCGAGGGFISGGGTPPSELVNRLAGDYDIALQQDSNTFFVRVSGTTNELSGTGAIATQPPVPYTYSGTLGDDGALNLRVTLTDTANTYDIQGTLTLGTDGTASGTGPWRRLETSANGAFLMTRTRALPVASGPVNSLVDTLNLSSVASDASRGAALSPDGKTLYTFAGGKVHAFKTADKSLLQSIALSNMPNFLAASADGAYLYAGGTDMTAINLSSGTPTPLNTTGPIQWLSTPTISSAATRAYFGGGDGKGRKVDMGASPNVQLLPSLGAGNSYDAAAVSANNSRVLVTTRDGAAAIGAGSNEIVVAPFSFSLISQPTPAPVAAASDGGLLYAVEAAHPPRVIGVDLDARTAVGAQSVGRSGTQIADIALSPDGTRLVLTAADSPRVYVLSTSPLVLLQAIDINLSGSVSGSARIAIAPSSARAYVSGQNALAIVRLK